MPLAAIKKIKFNKTWAVLAIALSMGVLAALAARSYLSTQMEAIQIRAKGQQINLIVAKRDLKKGEKVSNDNVAVRPVPADYAHSIAINPNDFERLNGRVMAYPVKSGELILWGLLESKKAPSFSTNVAAGYRAITVPVDEINSISGMLEPGDKIDLMVSMDRKGKKITFSLLQNVQVMATGQRSIDDPKNGERRQYSTVTLNTTPEQAHNIIVARDVGKITALLRNPQDKQTANNNSTDVANLLGVKTDGQTLTLDSDKQVPVLYGGRGSKLPPEGLNMGQASAPYATNNTGESNQVPIMNDARGAAHSNPISN